MTDSTPTNPDRPVQIELEIELNCRSLGLSKKAHRSVEIPISVGKEGSIDSVLLWIDQEQRAGRDHLQLSPEDFSIELQKE